MRKPFFCHIQTTEVQISLCSHITDLADQCHIEPMVDKLIASKLWYLSRLVCVVTEDMFSNEVHVAQVLPGLCTQKMHA